MNDVYVPGSQVTFCTDSFGYCDPTGGKFMGGAVVSYSGTTLTANIAFVNGSGSFRAPSVYTYGIWQSDNAGSAGATPTWKQLGSWPLGSLDRIVTISGDPGIYGRVYVGFGGSGYARYN